MNIARLALVFLFALGGCSVLVESALEDRDGGGGGIDGGVDANVDTSTDSGTDSGTDVELFDCLGMADGIVCGEGRICLRNLCEMTRCGDGFTDTDAGEECDELDDVSGDGCEPVTCQFSCSETEDCVATECVVGACTENVCVSTPVEDGTACTPPTGDDGTCQSGTCISANCGNGVIDAGEDCEPGMFDGCIACQYQCENNDECDDGQACNGIETCDTDQFACVSGTPLDCDDGEPCTDDACSELSGTCLNVLIDADMDGYASTELTCTNASLGGDCAPLNPKINPGAAELCDDIDNNCRDGVDENDMIRCYSDVDMDSFGGGIGIPRTCECNPGEVTRPDDCADQNASVHPNQIGWFTAPYCLTGASCFDYNCDGESTLETTQRGGCMGAFGMCTAVRGWVNEVPGCGMGGAFVEGCGGSCSPIVGMRPQRCR